MSDADFSQLTTFDKLQHKLWKARISAYEELTRLLESGAEASDFASIEPHLKNMVTDSNVVAQEAALSVVLEYIRHSPHASDSCNSVVPALVEKCFGAVKVGTKQKATEIALLYAEVAQPDRVLEYLMPGTVAKQPKVIVQTVMTLKELVRQFGIQSLDSKCLLKSLPKLFSHTDKNVRREAFHLTVEMYRWLGISMKSSLSSLKPVQLKELEEAFEHLPPQKPIPERTLRVRPTQKTQVTKEVTVETAHVEISAYDLADPVDISENLPKGFFTMIASKKWQERRDALEALLKQAKTPKIKDNDYHELIQALALRIHDANVMLVGIAADCMEAIAQGLRESIAKYKSKVIPVMIEKLKERKPMIVERLSKAIHAVFCYVPVASWLEEITKGLGHKNPQVRAECLKLVTRQLASVRPEQAQVRPIGMLFKKALEDAEASVRDAAAQGLGTMKKVLGEKTTQVFTDALDDLKLGKINAFYQQATLPAQPSGVKSTPLPPPTVKPTTESPPVKRRLSTGPAMPRKKPARMSIEPIYAFSAEEALMRAQALLPKTLLASLADPGWKTRLEAVGCLEGQEGIEPEVKVRLLLSRKETNFQVTGQMFGCFERWASQTGFGTGCAALCIPPLVEKLSDAKLKQAAMQCLSTLAEKHHLQFVLSRLYPVLASTKSPKLLADALLWMHQALIAFGMEGLALDDLLACVRTHLVHTHVTVRTRAIVVMGALRPYLGKEALMQDLSPALLAMIETEFARVAPLQATQVFKKTQADRSPLDPSPSTASGLQTHGSDPPSPSASETRPKEENAAIGVERVGRVDISEALVPFLALCGDPDSQVRNEGLQGIQGVLAKHPKIKWHVGSAFVTEMSERLKDKNKPNLILAVAITGRLADAMGPGFEKHLKRWLAPVVDTLVDPKGAVRTAGLATLAAFRQACGMAPMVAGCEVALTNEHPVLRRELLGWLNKTIGMSEPGCSWTGLIGPLFSCVQDRHAEVRKEAMLLLPAVVAQVGLERVLRQASELKPAEQVTLMPLLRAVEPQEGSMPVRSTPEAGRVQRVFPDEKQQRLLETLRHGDTGQRIEALKQYDRHVTTDEASVVAGLDLWVCAIVVQIQSLYTSVGQEASHRLWKYLSRALIVTFANRRLAQEVSRECLNELLKELCRRMTDGSMKERETFKLLNVVMIRVIDHSRLNDVLSVLLDRLLDVALPIQVTDALTGTQVKSTELVMKCLWKLAKTIPEALSEGRLNPDDLLYEINRFFIAAPSAVWKTRRSQGVPCGELPFRTAKVLLFDMVNTLGHDIWSHLSRIDQVYQSEIFPYITHMLGSCKNP
ncbi:armadillo-type protein [Sporodiniella umbellata]|nr:armadillo-type protein [Sporodiniella umbellata]